MTDALTPRFREFAAGMANLSAASDARLEYVSRLCDVALVLCRSSEITRPEAGCEDNESQDPGSAAADATVKALRAFKGWRFVLMPNYSCIDDDRVGGFCAYLYNSDGSANGEYLRWASEVHYVYASACLLEHGRAHRDFIFQLSLNSGSWLSTDIGATRHLAKFGSCHVFLQPANRWVPINHPENFTSALEEDPRLQLAVWRAAKARYSQHALSKNVLLATGRAALTMVVGETSQSALIELMEVRAYLQMTDSLQEMAPTHSALR